MDPVIQIIIAARRRLFLQGCVKSLGWLLAGGLWVAALVLLSGRLFAVPWPHGVYLWLWGGVVLGSVFAAWWGVPGREATAGLIDRRLGLKDRLGSALFAKSVPSEPMSGAVVRDAQAAARVARVAGAFPVRLTRGWAWAVVPVGVLAAVWALVPQMDLLGLDEARADTRSQEARAQQASEQVLQTVGLLEETALLEDKPLPMAGVDEELAPRDAAEALRQLSELSPDALADEKDRQKAAAKLSQLQEQIDAQTRRQRELLEGLQNSLSRLEPEVAGPAERLAEDLRNGDIEGAQQAAQELAEQIESMSPQEREALAEQMQDLARQLEEVSRQRSQDETRTLEQMRERLSQLPPQDAQQLQEGLGRLLEDDEALREALERQGLDPQETEQAIEQLKKLNQTQQSQRQCKEGLEDLSKAMDEAGRAVADDQKRREGAGQQEQPQEGQPQQPMSPVNDSLSRLAKMKEMLKRLVQARDQTQRAMDELLPARQSRQGDGREPSTADAPDSPLGPERRVAGNALEPVNDAGGEQGRVISSWLTRGAMDKDKPGVGFEQAAQQARDEAEQAVSQQRVPPQYHEAIREYFSQMPDDAGQITNPESPTR